MKEIIDIDHNVPTTNTKTKVILYDVEDNNMMDILLNIFNI